MSVGNNGKRLTVLLTSFCELPLSIFPKTSWRRFLVIQLQSFFQVCNGVGSRFALAGDIDFQTLGDTPVAFLPDTCGEVALHLRAPFL